LLHLEVLAVGRLALAKPQEVPQEHLAVAVAVIADLAVLDFQDLEIVVLLVLVETAAAAAVVVVLLLVEQVEQELPTRLLEVLMFILLVDKVH
jgi:hypothetical protein